MFDANGNPIIPISEWTALIHVTVSIALVLCVAAVATATKYRE